MKTIDELIDSVLNDSVKFERENYATPTHVMLHPETRNQYMRHCTNKAGLYPLDGHLHIYGMMVIAHSSVPVGEFKLLADFCWKTKR